MQASKAMARLRICAVSSEASLLADTISTKSSYAGPSICQAKHLLHAFVYTNVLNCLAHANMTKFVESADLCRKLYM